MSKRRRKPVRRTVHIFEAPFSQFEELYDDFRPLCERLNVAVPETVKVRINVYTVTFVFKSPNSGVSGTERYRKADLFPPPLQNAVQSTLKG